MKKGGEGCAFPTKSGGWRKEPCGGDMAAFVMADGGLTLPELSKIHQRAALIVDRGCAQPRSRSP